MKKTDMPTEWDLTLLYKSLTDPAIERDQRKADAAVASFAKRYRKDSRYLRNAKALADALLAYESLMSLPSAQALQYASFKKILNVADKEAEALSARLEARATKRGNQLLFFPLALGKISRAQQKAFLASPVLASYRYWLSQLFENAKYNLTEAEEKILSLKSDVSHGRWIQATSNIVNKHTVSFEGEVLPLPKAQAMVRTLPTPKRRELYGKLRAIYQDVADIAESEINAVYSNKKIEDELRGMKHPYESTVRGYQNDPKTILSLVDTVAAHNDIAHRFFKVKRTLLGEKQLVYADQAAAVGSLRTKMPFADAVKLVREVFGELDPAYADIFDRLLARGQVDVYPKKGKEGGAFCASGIGMPTFVLLNHIDDFESLKTLAHEMGHAVHAERTKTQRPIYQGHPISTAETASTFFETAALHRLIERLPKEEQIIALHDTLQDDMGSVFRQVACFRFEQDLHAEVRKEGYVPKERIAALMQKHMQAYLGPAVTVDEADGYIFTYWSHIRYFFYVYSYAYGQLISKSLYRRVVEDPAYIKKVDGFLSAGEHKSPRDIFASCGLNTVKPEVFQAGLDQIAENVARLERLVSGDRKGKK